MRRRAVWLVVILPVAIVGLLYLQYELRHQLERRCAETPMGREDDPRYPAWRSGVSYEWSWTGLTCDYDNGERLELGWWP